MMTDTLSSELLEFIRDEVALSDDPLTADTNLLLSGVVDSLGVIRITHWLEERTGRSIPAGDVTLENFHSAAAIAAYMEASVSASDL
jgi:acyl carrier protein